MRLEVAPWKTQRRGSIVECNELHPARTEYRRGFGFQKGENYWEITEVGVGINEKKQKVCKKVL